MSWNRNWKRGLIGVAALSMLAACSSNGSTEEASTDKTENSDLTLAQIEEKAKKKVKSTQLGCRILGQTGAKLGTSLAQNIA